MTAPTADPSLVFTVSVVTATLNHTLKVCLSIGNGGKVSVALVIGPDESQIVPVSNTGE